MPKKKIEPKPILENKLKKDIMPEPISSEKPIITRHRRTKAELEASQIKEVLVTEPNPLFIPLIKMPFELWSANKKIEDLKLTDSEASALALPITQLANYYFPKIPHIAICWVNLVIISYGLMSARIMIVKELEKSKEKPAEQKSSEKSAEPQTAQ